VGRRVTGMSESGLGFSILLVDDDKLLVEKYKDTVNWEGCGISMVFTAYNIRQAKTQLQEYPIDILLCDVDMPQGSGLELLEWLRNQNQDIECVFLSSYANFAYAQAAVRYSARDYLLKPISNAGLEERIAQVADIVRTKKKQGRKSLERRKDAFWNSLLRVRSEGRKLVEAALREGLYGQDSQVKLVILRAWANPAAENYKKDIALCDFVLHNIALEIFGSAGKRLEAIVGIQDYQWVLVLAEREDEALASCISGLKRNLEQSIFEGSCIYIGEDGRFPEAEALFCRLEYVEENAVDDGCGVIYAAEWACPGDSPKPPWEAWWRMLNHLGTREAVKEAVCAFLEEVQAEGGWRRESLSAFRQELSLFLLRAISVQGRDMDQIREEMERRKYGAMNSLENMKGYVKYLFGRLEEGWKGESLADNAIELVKGYIEQCLGEDINRSILAEKACLSEDYLSKLFANKTGMSIPAYIASRRMERAKEYLDGTSLTIGEVAMKVGYSNFSYFSKTFRELVGCTPNEYRNKEPNGS
jgi:two-component system response regulator YesN